MKQYFTTAKLCKVLWQRIYTLVAIFSVGPLLVLGSGSAHASAHTPLVTKPSFTQSIVSQLPAYLQKRIVTRADGSFSIQSDGLNHAQVSSDVNAALKKAMSNNYSTASVGPHVTTCPVYNSNGGVDGVWGIHSDLTTHGCNQAVTMQGYTYASKVLAGSAPKPAYIIIGSQVVLNGVSASINIGSGSGAGFTASGTNVASYNGTFDNTYDAIHSYTNLDGWSALPWSVDQSDNAIFRVGNRDYNPNDKVTVILPW